MIPHPMGAPARRAMALAVSYALMTTPRATSAGAGDVGRSRDMFSEASAYERFMGRWSRMLAPQFIAFSGTRDGDRVLDVGCGTGTLTFALEAQTRKSRITGVDISPEYVTYARKQPSHRTSFEVGDAQALRFANGAFDATVSLLVMNFIPDSRRALSEMVRVTRPGGTVAAAVWDYAGGMQMLRIFWDEAVAADPAAEPRDERHMPLSHEGELAALWRAAGLEDVVEEARTVPMRFASFDDYWSPFLLGEGPAGAYVASLAADQREALRARLRQRLLRGGPDHPLELRGQVWVVRGRVPQGPQPPPSAK